jgi:beta-lactamase regulating signal transducer with metallopeptidase domain
MNSLPISTALVEALGWTIVHSLWQATLLAGILWMASRAIKNAQLRYTLAYGTLLAQLVVSIVTFGWLYEPAKASAAVLTVSDFVQVFGFSETTTGVWQQGNVLPVVVILWGLGLLVGTLRLGVSFGRVRRMRRTVLKAVPVDFHLMVRSLADRIGYTGQLRVAISEKVGGPALIGHLKPLLLFPIAIINQLTPDEAEAVILHELAHLQRKDHWWNLLQCIIEVLFQYHPMVWWIGARIREEREHCCDDLVLAYGPGGLPYAKALLYFETQNATPATAVALTNTPGGLLGRVQRFLHQQNIPYQMKSRLFLLPLLAIIALVSTAAYAPGEKADDGAAVAAAVATTLATLPSPAPAAAAAAKTDAPVTPLVVPMAIDTLPKGRHQVSSYRNGKSTEVTVEDGAIKSLKIDGKTIPETEFDAHESMVERLLGVDQPRIRTFRWNGSEIEGDLDNMNLELEGSAIEFENLFERLGESFEGFGESFEGWGEQFENLGEGMGENFERIFSDSSRTFRFHSGNGGSFRLNDGDGSTFFFSDSINVDRDFDNLRLNDNVRIFRDGDGMSADHIFLEREKSMLSEEEQIREMETMIEKLERKKAKMQLELGREGREVVRGQAEELREAQRANQEEQRELAAAQRGTATTQREMELAARRAEGGNDKYKDVFKQLRKEGLVPEKDISRFSLSGEYLKVNGKKMSKETHARFLEIYKMRYGNDLGKKFKVDYKSSSF